MLPEETGKQRASRIPLDYFRSPNPLERWKGRLGWIALLAPAAWLGAGLVFSREADFHASRGPVASVHQAWESQCSACHVPFQAISSHSFVPPLIGHAQASDNACQACHAGPVHHATQTPGLSCASCHRDHRGAEASLVRVADSDCTQCHKHLASHGKLKDYADVTRFDVDHPGFRSLQSDPGKLKFNHQLHLTRGMASTSGSETGGVIWTFAQIPEVYRERYAKAQEAATGQKVNDATPVQLDCKACHQLDAADFPLARGVTPQVAPGLVPPRSPGAYFLPITYENQCIACHPLGVGEFLPDGKLTEFTLPHRLEPRKVLELLRAHYTTQAALGQVGLLDRKIAIPLPGKKIEPLLEAKFADLVKKNMARADVQLFLDIKKNCALCHEFEGAGDKRTVTPPNVPLVWFEHARFDHMAHRGVRCQDCHTRAESSFVSTDVLVPDHDNCVKCHAPRGSVAGKTQGGVRFDCALCHRYHNGDNPWQGRGAPARGVGNRAGSIEQFLGGKLR